MSDKARQIENMTAAKQASATDISGLNLTKIREGYPQYIAGERDSTWQGQTNGRIVISGDRPSDLTSGHGGAGETHCATITMTAGAQGIKASDINIFIARILFISSRY